MKGKLLFLSLFLSSILLSAQTINSDYAKALYKQYPTQKTDFCPACKLWVNPYYRAIADTLTHTPIVTYYVYTKAHRIEQEAVNIPRSGVYSAWHAADGQVSETAVYAEANKQSSEVIAKGHCQAWILLAWCADAAILSNTYTFNAAMEYQGQNVGTQIATEELCRELTGFKRPALTDSVKMVRYIRKCQNLH